MVKFHHLKGILVDWERTGFSPEEFRMHQESQNLSRPLIVSHFWYLSLLATMYCSLPLLTHPSRLFILNGMFGLLRIVMCVFVFNECPENAKSVACLLAFSFLSLLLIVICSSLHRSLIV